MELMETRPFLTLRDTGALRKSSDDGSIKDDIEALNDDQGWPSPIFGSRADAGLEAPPINLRTSIPLLLIGIILSPYYSVEIFDLHMSVARSVLNYLACYRGLLCQR